MLQMRPPRRVWAELSVRVGRRKRTLEVEVTPNLFAPIRVDVALTARTAAFRTKSSNVADWTVYSSQNSALLGGLKPKHGGRHYCGRACAYWNCGRIDEKDEDEDEEEDDSDEDGFELNGFIDDEAEEDYSEDEDKEDLSE